MTPDPFAAAGPAIFAAFADRERIVYTQGGVLLPPISAIRIDADAGDLLEEGLDAMGLTPELPQA